MTVNGSLREEFIYEVLSVVEEIPKGKVATYGQIARLIGREKNPHIFFNYGIIKIYMVT